MAQFERHIPKGDTRERDVCAACGYVAYENPRIIVGAVVHHAGLVLLCRRAIAPRLGFWTLPAGFLELGETTEAGALREAREEAGADIRIEGLLGLYHVGALSQVQMIFRAVFAGPPEIAAGEESLEVGLFDWETIPWDQIAFPSVIWSLREWHRLAGGPLGQPAGNPAALAAQDAGERTS